MDNKKNNKINDILSTVKLGSIVFIAIIFLNNIVGKNDRIYYDNTVMLKFIFGLFVAIIVCGLYYLWSFTLVKKLKITRIFIIKVIESIIFLIFFMFVIFKTGKHLSPYKIVFLFIIIPVAIEFNINYSIACASISSLYLLIIDLFFSYKQFINEYFENDIIISAIFITIAWLLSYYVKLEKEHSQVLQNRANNDSLTDLYNHRYFYDKLIDTVNLYDNSIDSIALIFMDIDYFKEYNDMYGHLSGDTVLKKMGKTLRDIVDTDIATIARYGGDEFAAIIINQTEKEVYDIGEKIRTIFEKMEFIGQENISAGNITVSIGIAMYNDDIDSYLELIKCADDALYRAKFIKKNRVEIYSSIFDMMKLDIEEEHIDLLTSIKTLISIINAKDKYTYGHVERVVIYSKMIAERLVLSEDEKNSLIYSAYMHDIGKINIPEDILNKKMPLTKSEWKQMKMHPQNGVEIIKNVESLSNIAPLIMHHHERFDGSGYPDNLKGDQIPFLARILTVADSFDAMTFSRPYRSAMTFAEASEELINCSGTQFDPDVTREFVAAIEHMKKNTNSYVPFKHNDYVDDIIK